MSIIGSSTSAVLAKLRQRGITQDDYFSSESEYDLMSFTMPFSKPRTARNELESVGMYQTVDLLCEGEVDGLSQKDGSPIQLTNDVAKNENGLRAIFLNDVPVKNASSSLNFNRVFFEFKSGSSRQSKLTSFTNDYLSFTKTYQTLNVNTRLVGINEALRTSIGNILTDVQFPAGDDSNTLGQVSYDEKSLSFTYKIGNTPQSFVGLINPKGNFLSDLMGQTRNVPFPYVHNISNQNVTTFSFTCSIASLKNNDKETAKAGNINLVVKIGYTGDENPLGLTGDEDSFGSVKYFLVFIYGVCTSTYERTFFFRLPPTINGLDRSVSIYRIDEEPGPKEIAIAKHITIKSVSEIVDTPFNYPNSCIAAASFDARSFQQPPKRTFNVRMKKVLVPSNYNPETRRYSGNWDGLFKTEKQWTDNPAWIFYDLATNTTYGAGKFGFADYFLDKWNLYQISKYCDELVPTGNSNAFAQFNCTVDGPWVSVSQSGLSALEISSSFPNGAIVSFIETFDENGVLLEKSFKRLIVHGKEEGNYWKFKICDVPVASEIFEQNPNTRDEYYNGAQTVSAEAWLIDILASSLEGVTSTYSFVNGFVENGFPLDSDVATATVNLEITANGQYNLKPLLEPRFRCNIYLDRSQNALDALNDIAAVFRGMMYWTAGYMFLSNDRKKDAVLLFTNANVTDGDFTYSGSANTSRTTVVLIRYNDETDQYKPKVEYLEDPAGIRDHGYKEKEVIGLGVTSKSQAHRLAKWMLYTNQTETDTVQFSTGQEASFLRPGDTIKIQDKLKSAKRYGGRIVDVDAAAKSFIIDEGIVDNLVGQKISIIVGTENYNTKKLDELAITQANGVSDADINKTRQPQIKQFTISSVDNTNRINCISASFEDINAIKNGAVWSVINTDDAVDIKEVLYRVLSVIEKSPNEFQVTAMMYNESKFNGIDRFLNVQSANKQQSKSTSSTLAQAIPNALSEEQNSIVAVKFYLTGYENNRQRYDGRFDVGRWSTDRNAPAVRYVKLFIDWSQVAFDNNVTSSNTGGYILEVTRGSNDRIRITLDGYDNTTANILFGVTRNETGSSSYSVTVYRYDTDKRLETIGLPD